MALTFHKNLPNANYHMLAPAADTHSSNHPELLRLRRPVPSGVEAPSLLTILQAIVIEVMPQQRGLTASQNALLRALSEHLEAAAHIADISKSGHGSKVQTGFALDKTRALELQLRQLTPAELEIVSLLRRGLSNKEIAYGLDKSVKTVKTQLTSVYRKFAVRTRSRLLAKLL